jgi:hypothetical protein
MAATDTQGRDRRMKSSGWIRASRLKALAMTAGALALCSLALPGVAAAAGPEPLWQAPADGKAGSDAGRMGNARAIAADPTSGHLYVSDAGNNRVGEFDAFGQFVKAFGWGVADGTLALQSCGPGATPPTLSCQASLQGEGPGQFSSLFGGIAVDSAGDVYVADPGNNRIQKFNSAGQFLWMVGGGVNKGPNNPGNLCTAAHIAGGDTCGAGTSGTGPGQFESVSEGLPLTIGPGGVLLVGDVGRVQEIEPTGAYKGDVPNPEGVLTGKAVFGLATDSGGNFYFSFSGQGGIYKLSPGGSLLETLAEEALPQSLAVDASDNLYAVIFQPAWEVLEFGPAGEELIGPGSGFASAQKGGFLAGIATNTVTAAGAIDVYVADNVEGSRAALRAFGPTPDRWPLPVRPPEITAQYATEVEPEGAALRAQINPHLWPDTKYYVQYGTGKCSEGGCTATTPLPPGAQLAATADFPATTAPVTLSGLEPATTYRFRFIAQSGGGGPVKGVGPGEAEGTFTTPAEPSSGSTACANQRFRGGPSARLADCRAYEMVSPLDKNNSDIVSLPNISSDPSSVQQSSLDGEKLAYSAYRAFGDAEGAPYASQYIATRGAAGWQTHSISPPQGLSQFPIGRTGESQFRSFTADLCSATLLQFSERLLAPGGAVDYPNVYRRQNCGSESYETLTNVVPPAIGVSPPDVQGVSADGRCTVFRATEKLTPNAHPLEGVAYQVYESCGGELRLVSALPTGAPAFAATVGTASGASAASAPMRRINVTNAISDDGSRVYWTAAVTTGALYLRQNSDQPASPIVAGVCTEPEKACTIQIVPSKGRFWTANADGSRALYMVEQGSTEVGNLFAYDAVSRTSSLIAGQVMGLLGASDDTSRIYLVSREVRAPGALAGAPNLYLYENGTFNFIATLSAADAVARAKQVAGVNVGFLSPLSVEPFRHTSKVTPSGGQVVFMSNAPLNGYDNTDANNGQPVVEVYRYAAGGSLLCISCNPTGVQPQGRELELQQRGTGLWAAAQIARANSQLYAPRVISDDGGRVFFESFEPLLPTDINGKADVYQWEAPGTGDCTTTAPYYSPPNGGCISLISSGQSSRDSYFVDASTDGSDVFFSTIASLVPEDEDLVDIYNARVEGGFPPPPAPPVLCSGEACQPPASSPSEATPASSTFSGPGNQKQQQVKKKKKHKKKQMRGKKRKQGKHANAKRDDRRPGRAHR